MKFEFLLSFVLSMISLFGTSSALAAIHANAGCILALQEAKKRTESRLPIPKTEADILALVENEGLTSKGFVTGYVEEVSHEVKAKLAEMGVINWSMRVMVAKSIEDAQRIFALENKKHAKDPVFRHLYLIDPDLVLTSSNNKRVINLSYYQSLLTKPLIYWDYTDQETIHEVPLNDRLWRFNPKNVVFIYSKYSDTVFASNNGYVFPKARGIISVQEFLKSGNHK